MGTYFKGAGMLAEISAGLGSLKAASDILKGLNAASTQAAINEVKIGLQERIFEAREALTAAQDAQTVSLQRIRDLEKEVARFEAWEAEKQRYQLTDYGGGTFAYALKPEASSGEPAHRICAHCYQEGHKSILQNAGGRASGREAWNCPACKQEFFFGHYQPYRRRNL